MCINNIEQTKVVVIWELPISLLAVRQGIFGLGFHRIPQTSPRDLLADHKPRVVIRVYILAALNMMIVALHCIKIGHGFSGFCSHLIPFVHGQT